MNRTHRSTQTLAPDGLLSRSRLVLGVGIILPAALLWSFWPTLALLWRDWQRDDDYSVGQLVPLVGLYLVWQERHRLAKCSLRPAWLVGGAMLLFAQAVRAFGLVWLFESAERYSVVFTVIGLVLLVGGVGVFWTLKWVLLFLFLMVPLPGRVHNMISGPLQDAATAGAVFVLELFGTVVAREGHVMLLNDNTRVAVAEACSGLRMLTAFVVVSAVFAYVARRPAWHKVTLLASSIPIAIGCNTARLVVTAGLFMFTTSDTAEKFFHDFAGLSMMPLAVAILVGELWLMNKLVAAAPDTPAQVRSAQAQGDARSMTGSVANRGSLPSRTA